MTFSSTFTSTLTFTRIPHPSYVLPVRCRLLQLIVCIVSLWCSGCGLSTDVSGWELVPKGSGASQMEQFPDLPVNLPDSAPVQPRLTVTSPMHGTYLNKLDYDSLFRRGYSTPTP